MGTMMFIIMSRQSSHSQRTIPVPERIGTPMASYIHTPWLTEATRSAVRGASGLPKCQYQQKHVTFSVYFHSESLKAREWVADGALAPDLARGWEAPGA